VSGVVLRAPAAPNASSAPPRYRERRRERADDEAPDPSGCACNPGLFAVVHLEGDGLPAPRLPVRPPTMAQKDRMFVPSVIAIPVGGTIAFPNLDPFFHNVFSYSSVRKFDLGRYPEGESESVTFDEPGIVPIFCEIHYSMRAYVHVLDTPYFAVTDERRRFEIPDVRSGDYVLHVWQEGLPPIEMPITVGDEPLRLEVR
jgi:hypothetical protein